MHVCMRYIYTRTYAEISFSASTAEVETAGMNPKWLFVQCTPDSLVHAFNYIWAWLQDVLEVQKLNPQKFLLKAYGVILQKFAPVKNSLQSPSSAAHSNQTLITRSSHCGRAPGTDSIE